MNSGFCLTLLLIWYSIILLNNFEFLLLSTIFFVLMVWKIKEYQCKNHINHVTSCELCWTSWTKLSIWNHECWNMEHYLENTSWKNTLSIELKIARMSFLICPSMFVNIIGHSINCLCHFTCVGHWFTMEMTASLNCWVQKLDQT